MKTDEELAKEYAEGLVLNITGKCDKYAKRSTQFDGHDLEDAFSNGFKKCCELGCEKVLRFAEFIAKFDWMYNHAFHFWFKNSKTDTRSLTTEELYTSKEFEDYLNGIKK